MLCFGPDAADYRVELFDGYHAQRPEVPDTLAPQFADARPFFEAFGWTIADSDSFEADDLLGSLAKRETEAGGRTLVMTGDRDMYQCAGERVQVLYVRTGGKQGAELVDAAEVKRRYGIPPELVPDFIALRGDPSDGIPGAKGIGEKTAAELLTRHGSLEAALERGVRETKKTRACRALHAGGRAARLQGDRDPPGRARGPAAGHAHGLRGRGRGGPRARHGAARETTRSDEFRCVVWSKRT